MDCSSVSHVNKLLSFDDEDFPSEIDYDTYISLILSALESWPDDNAIRFAAACASFYCFQCMHRCCDTASILKGDYFFSRFLNNVIELDSIQLIKQFVSELINDSDELHIISPEFVRNCAICYSQDGEIFKNDKSY